MRTFWIKAPGDAIQPLAGIGAPCCFGAGVHCIGVVARTIADEFAVIVAMVALVMEENHAV